MAPQYLPTVSCRIMKSCYAPSHCSGCVERRDCDGQLSDRDAQLAAKQLLRDVARREMRPPCDDTLDAARYHRQMMLEPFGPLNSEFRIHPFHGYDAAAPREGLIPTASQMREYFINDAKSMKEVAEAMLPKQKKLAPWQVPMLPAIPQMKKIICGDPVTVVIWMDDTKTIVRRSEDTPYSEYNAVAAAICEKMFGSNTTFKKDIAKKIEKQKPKKVKSEPQAEVPEQCHCEQIPEPASLSDISEEIDQMFEQAADDVCYADVPEEVGTHSVPNTKNPSILKG